MHGTSTSNKVFWANHPTASESSGCENLTSRIDAEDAVVEIFVLDDFRDRVSQHIIIAHAFIDVVFDYDDMRILPHDFGNSIQLFMGEDLSNRVVRSGDNQYLCLFIDGSL
jgi:hypothetical protein